MPGHRKPALAAKSVGGLKYFKRLQPLFARLHDLGTDHDPAGNRRLHFDHYASLLLYVFNPGLTSLRAIQKASELDTVQRKRGVPRTSLGSLSAASVFDPEPLRAIIAELAAEAPPVESGREAEVLRGLTAVDGSLLPALTNCFRTSSTPSRVSSAASATMPTTGWSRGAHSRGMLVGRVWCGSGGRAGRSAKRPGVPTDAVDGAQADEADVRDAVP